MKKLFTVSAVAALGGCSLFGWDDFSGGEATNDGGAIDDATNDPPQKVSPPGDGAIDGGADSAPSGPFCKTVGANAAVCDDFEEPGTFTGKWPAKDLYLGTLEVLDGIGITGRGLRFSATPRADGQVGQDGRVVLGWASPTAASYVDTEIAVKLTSIPPTTYSAAPLYVEWARADGGRARVGFLLDGKRELAVNPTVFYADGGVVGSGGKVITTLAIGTWTRIRLVVDMTKTPHSLFAYVDGALKHEMTIIEFTPAKVSVFVGAHYVGTEDGGTVGFDLDDARVSWK
jgi:hypothetical protein